MIVDLRIDSKHVLILGGGKQAAKRFFAMAQEGCTITLVSPVISEDIMRASRSGRADVRTMEADITILDDVKPDIVVAATDNAPLNREIMAGAKERGIVRYSASDPDSSDYAHLATTEFDGVVRVAVSTGGRSPAMARKIRDNIRENIASVVTPDILSAIREGRPAR